MGRPKETFGESTAASINPSVPFSRIASAEAFEMGRMIHCAMNHTSEERAPLTLVQSGVFTSFGTDVTRDPPK